MIVFRRRGFILDSNQGLHNISPTEKLTYGSLKLVRTKTFRRHDSH